MATNSSTWAAVIERAAAEAMIDQIAAAGRVAVVVADDIAPDYQAMATALGWDGSALMWRLSRRRQRKYAADLQGRGQGERAAWVSRVRPRAVRVLLVADGIHMLTRKASRWVSAVESGAPC